MTRSDTLVSGGLAGVGIVSILLGLGSIVYASTVIYPRIKDLSRQSVQSVKLAEQSLNVLAAHSEVLGQLNPARSSALATLQALPPALERSALLSQHAADALDRSATTLHEVEDDLGILLPNNALQRNAEALTRSAQSLRGLSPVLHQLHEETDTAAADLTRTSKQAARLQDHLQRTGVTLDTMQAQLQQTRTALQTAGFPSEISRLVGLVGGLFLLNGILLLGMAGLWRRMIRMAPDRTSEHPPRAS